MFPLVFVAGAFSSPPLLKEADLATLNHKTSEQGKHLHRHHQASAQTPDTRESPRYARVNLQRSKNSRLVLLYEVYIHSKPACRQTPRASWSVPHVNLGHKVSCQRSVETNTIDVIFANQKRTRFQRLGLQDLEWPIR